MPKTKIHHPRKELFWYLWYHINSFLWKIFLQIAKKNLNMTNLRFFLYWKPISILMSLFRFLSEIISMHRRAEPVNTLCNSMEFPIAQKRAVRLSRHQTALLWNIPKFHYITSLSFIFCFKCAMDLFLSYESPPLITCIYVNSFRDCMMMDSIDTDFYLFILDKFGF